MDDRHLPEPDSEQAPERLVQELRSLAQRSSVWVPPSVDAAILKAATKHLAGHSATVHPPRNARAPWLRLAACFFVATVIAVLLMQRRGGFDQERTADVDGNGEINILDAFALARRLKEHPEAPGPFDVNRDHQVNAADVEAIAVQAVAFKGDAGS